MTAAAKFEESFEKNGETPSSCAIPEKRSRDVCPLFFCRAASVFLFSEKTDGEFFPSPFLPGTP